MKNAVIVNIIKKISTDFKGSGKGRIVLKGVTFQEGKKKFTLGEISINWDFSGIDSSAQEGTSNFKGDFVFHMHINNMLVEAGNNKTFLIESFVADSVADIENLFWVFPMEEIQKLLEGKIGSMKPAPANQ